MVSILLLYIGGGILLSAIPIPLILRKIKPNYFYGFRIKATLEDPRVWYEANAYAGKRLVVAGIVTVITAVGFYWIPQISVDTYALACMTVTMGALVITFIQSVRYIKTIKK